MRDDRREQKSGSVDEKASVNKKSTHPHSAVAHDIRDESDSKPRKHFAQTTALDRFNSTAALHSHPAATATAKASTVVVDR